MEFRPTFYSISGFLIPGIVLIAALVLEVEKSRTWVYEQVRTHAASPGDSTAVGIIITVTLIAIALSCCFVVGSVVSELFQLTYRFGIRRRRFFFQKKSINDSTHDLAKDSLNHGSLEHLLKADLDARETFAYQQTCGLDLHWFAGRNRMVGGSGLACVIAGLVAILLCLSFWLWLSLALFGMIAMAIAAYRMMRFEEYVTRTAVVALWRTGPKPSGEESSK